VSSAYFILNAVSLVSSRQIYAPVDQLIEELFDEKMLIKKYLRQIVLNNNFAVTQPKLQQSR